MKTETPNIKSITLHGEQLTLYQGRGDSWFLHEEEAINHSHGHTVAEATMLITGKWFPRYPYAKAPNKKYDARIYTSAFRYWLDGVDYDANQS
jgi:hypothetical protein